MKGFSRQVRRFGQAGLATLCVSLLSILALWSGVLDVFEATTFDWRVRLLARPSPAASRIRVVLLDQSSLDWAMHENGLSWPWPREMYGLILDFCRRGQAASVAFDVLYTEPSSYGVTDDQSFGRVGTEYGRMVLPVFLGQQTGDMTYWPDFAPVAKISSTLIGDLGEKAQKNLTFPRASFPIAGLAQTATGLGNVQQNPDPDGVYRRIALVASFDNRIVPALPLASYLAAYPEAKLEPSSLGLRLDKTRIPLDSLGRVLINFHTPDQAYIVHSAAEIIRSELLLREGQPPEIDPTLFANTHVLFGFSAPGLFDLRPAPVAGVYSGVEIHAQVLGNLLIGDFLHDAPSSAVVLWTMALVLAASLACLLGASTVAAGLAIVLFLPLPVLASCAAYWWGWNLPLVLPETALIIALGASILLNYATEGRQKRFIKSAFKQYLSGEVIEELLRHPERMRLGGERRTLSIFFSDLQDFTSLSESLTPEELTLLLNEYLTAMTEIIMDEGGTVDKYVGDAIVAFWNAPLDQPDHAQRALRAAQRCQDKLAELRPVFRQRVDFDILMRIGLNTGPAVVGNLGSQARFSYTMLGDAVNLAARLEGINKQFGTYTLISQAVLDAAPDTVATREIGRIVVVGRKEAVVVYEPMSFEELGQRRSVLETFAQALALYYTGDFTAARDVFALVAKVDPAAAAYVRQCTELLANPPGSSWPGHWVMTRK